MFGIQRISSSVSFFRHVQHSQKNLFACFHKHTMAKSNAMPKCTPYPNSRLPSQLTARYFASHQIIETRKAPKIPYAPQGIVNGGFLFTSTIGPTNPSTKRIEFAAIEGQAREVFTSLSALLWESNVYFEDVVHVHLYLKNPEDEQALMDVYAFYFDKHQPTLTITLTNFINPDVLLEIDVIAKTREKKQ